MRGNWAWSEIPCPFLYTQLCTWFALSANHGLPAHLTSSQHHTTHKRCIAYTIHLIKIKEA